MQASPPSKGEEEAGEHQHMCHPRLSLGGAQTSFLAASSKANIWNRRLGHPGTTMMRKMIPILPGHDLCTSDAVIPRLLHQVPSILSQVSSSTSLYFE
jgi:hypothetical protein